MRLVRKCTRSSGASPEPPASVSRHAVVSGKLAYWTPAVRRSTPKSNAVVRILTAR
jgi:hypothetical protein